jgi:tRNA (guanosine-2'-O-)-methyltransferase
MTPPSVYAVASCKLTIFSPKVYRKLSPRMESLSQHSDPVLLDGVPFTASEVIDVMNDYLGEVRREKIQRVISQRTYTVVPVLEGLYDRGNVSAVMRTAEALGYQAMHIIESSKRFKKANRVTQGADKWMDITRWDDTQSCIDHLRAKGYRIVVTHMSETAQPIDAVSFTQPTAIFFGNEKEGVSPELVAQADDCVVIPMTGFAQSFNISVAAALTLYHIHHERARELGAHGDLTQQEQDELTAYYYMRTVAHSEDIILRRDADVKEEL